MNRFSLRNSLKSYARFLAFPELRNYFLIRFLCVFGLNLNSAIFFLYPVQAGLSISEMMFAYFVVAQIAYFIFEIPTGIITDRFGSKVCTLAGIAFFSLAYFGRWSLPFIIAPMAAFAITETLTGMADATLNGTQEKYLYAFRERVSDTSVFANLHGMTFLVRAVSTLTGGAILAFLPMKWTQTIGGAVLASAFVLAAIFLKEPKTDREEVSNHWKDDALTGIGYVWKHRNVRYFTIAWAIALLGVYSSASVFQARFVELRFGPETFPLLFWALFTIEMVTCAIGAKFMEAEAETHDIFRFLEMTFILLAIGLGILAFTKNVPIAIIAFLFVSFWKGSRSVLATVGLNRLISKESIRATVNSTASVIAALWLVIGTPIIGRITDANGLSANFAISAGLLTIASGILFASKTKGSAPLNE